MKMRDKHGLQMSRQEDRVSVQKATLQKQAGSEGRLGYSWMHLRGWAQVHCSRRKKA